MYSLFARLGSLTAVVKGLQERGLATKNGNAFTRHAVRDILHNPVYARADADMLAWLRNAGAELSATQEEFDGRHGVLAYHRTDQSRGRTAVALPPEAWIVAVGQHPGLIPWRTVGRRAGAPADGLPHAAYGHETPRPARRPAACRCGRPMPPRGRRRALLLCSAVRNRPVDGNNAAARTFLALQQTPPCAPCSAPCRRTMAALAAALRGLRRGLPESSPAPPDRVPSCSAIAWTPSAGRSAS